MATAMAATHGTLLQGAIVQVAGCPNFGSRVLTRGCGSDAVQLTRAWYMYLKQQGPTQQVPWFSEAAS